METERTMDDNADRRNREENRSGCTGCQIGCGMLLFVLVPILYVLGFIPSCVPLVRDRAMIAHFREHREAFEAVVQHFRSFPDRAREAGAATPQNEVETKILLERAGLGVTSSGEVYLSCERLPNGCALWLPDPYHPDSRRKAQKMAKECSGEVERWYDAKRASGKSAKDFVADMPFPTCSLWNGLRYGALAFYPTGEELANDRFDYPTTGTKLYIHFPEAPKIEGSFWKMLFYPDPKAPERTRALTVVNSLNFFPIQAYKSSYYMHECRYRPIKGEPHWFLEMCITVNRTGM